MATPAQKKGFDCNAMVADTIKAMVSAGFKTIALFIATFATEWALEFLFALATV